MRRRLLARLPTLAAVAVIAGVAAFAFGPTLERKLFGRIPPGVTQLSDVSQLQAAFNRDDGSTRLLMIFSPT